MWNAQPEPPANPGSLWKMQAPRTTRVVHAPSRSRFNQFAGIAELSERLLKRKVRLFAIISVDFEIVKTEFMRQLKGGILPNKAEMNLFPHKKARKTQKDPLVDKAEDLFGEQNLVIVGGEES